MNIENLKFKAFTVLYNNKFGIYCLQVQYYYYYYSVLLSCFSAAHGLMVLFFKPRPLYQCVNVNTLWEDMLYNNMKHDDWASFGHWSISIFMAKDKILLLNKPLGWTKYEYLPLLDPILSKCQTKGLRIKYNMASKSFNMYHTRVENLCW